MGKKFTDFINKMDEEAKNNRNKLDPAKRIDNFREMVNSLYAKIDSWLQDELASQKIQTGIVPVTIVEELLGAYSVDEKWIQIGNAKIRLHPVGTILIGTNARIDLIYRSKTVMIVRTGENITSPSDLISVKIDGEPVRKKKPAGKAVWKYVRNNQRLSYVTLNKDSFENLLMDVIDGGL